MYVAYDNIKDHVRNEWLSPVEVNWTTKVTS